MTRSQKTILLVATALLVASIALPASSAGLLDLDQFKDPCDVCEFARLLSEIKNIVFLVAAPAAVLFVIIGGVLLSASAGMPNQVTRAKQITTSAIIGLIILVCAWLIVSAIMAATLGRDIGSSWWNISCPADTACKYQAASPTPTTPGTPPAGPGGQMGTDRANAAPRMKDFMDCMSQNVPAGENWTINSIMDYDHPACNAQNHGVGVGTCSHSAYSCHYGGRSPDCTDGSYAMDIAPTGATQAGLQNAAAKCGGAWVNWEGTPSHYHVSIGRRSGCDCDK